MFLACVFQAIDITMMRSAGQQTGLQTTEQENGLLNIRLVHDDHDNIKKTFLSKLYTGKARNLTVEGE